MAVYKIAVINQSAKVTAQQINLWVAALQIQVGRDFSSVWGVYCALYGHPRADAWPLYIVDQADVNGALGYHDIDARGLPYIKVFVCESAQAGVPLSAVMSHEILEVLADPFIETTVLNETANGTAGTIYAAEVCDPVEADMYEINGVTVSNFITPRWFGTMPGGGPYDFRGRLTVPLSLTSGGYYLFNPITASGLGGWRGVAGDHATRWDGNHNWQED